VFLKCSQRREDGKVHRSWSVIERRRYGGGKVAPRHVRYLGESNDRQRARGRKRFQSSTKRREAARQLAFFSADRVPPGSGAEAVQIRFDELHLENPRQ
jgi:hypothetical protein